MSEPSAVRGMAKLIINPTSSSRREVPLSRTIVSIGRDPSNDVVLPDAMVSRRHAVIEWRGSQYYLRDCNSSNGSLVNGDRVSERNLRDGDLVAIGTARLLFREELDVEDAGAKVVQHPSSPRLFCPTCQADYRKGDQFCRQCGTPIAPSGPIKVVCTSCGTAVPMPAKFCNACGHSLPGGPAGPRAESDMDVTKPRPVRELSAPPARPLPPTVDAKDAEASGGASGGPDVGSASPPVPAAGRLDSVARPDSSPAPAKPPSPPPSVEPPASRAEPPPPLSLAASAEPARPAPVRPPSPPSMTSRPSGARSSPSRPEPPRPEPRASRAEEPPAGFLARMAAGGIDALIVGAGQVVLLSPVLAYWWSHRSPANPTDVSFWPILLSLGLVPVVVALGCVYYVYYWGVKGATPGKRLLGLVVQGDDGSEPIGLSRATTRVLGYLLSGLSLGIGFLMIALTGNGLHDRIAGTRVVRRGRG